MTEASYSYEYCCFIYGFVLSGGQVLQIPRVQKEDAGRYTCQAVNEAGEDHMHFELEILGKWNMSIFFVIKMYTGGNEHHL